tara:strand:+ start:772 stop:1035 length:264 start_codon:yes stop_codon:yes gene_type:complete
MNREDVVKMAREAGGIDFTTTNAGGVTAWLGTGTPEFLERFAALVAANEREACAKAVESRKTGANELMDAVRDMEAAAIRARGEVPR